MKTLKIALFAAAAAVACSTSSAEERESKTVGGNTARDRNDTIRSGETRINTTGRDDEKHEVIKVNRSDRRFIEKAALHSHAELRIAKLAAEKSSNPQIRSYAQQLVRDHEQAFNELNQLASKKAVSLADFEDHMERPFNRLSEKSGADFDREFLEHMADAHEDDIAMYERAARKSDDVEIAAMASKHLPLLQQHKSTVDQMLNASKK